MSIPKLAQIDRKQAYAVVKEVADYYSFNKHMPICRHVLHLDAYDLKELFEYLSDIRMRSDDNLAKYYLAILGMLKFYEYGQPRLRVYAANVTHLEVVRSSGACDNGVGNLDVLFKYWKYFSGCDIYPVPGHKSLMCEGYFDEKAWDSVAEYAFDYYGGDKFGKNPYGKSRRKLLIFLRDCLRVVFSHDSVSVDYKEIEATFGLLNLKQ